MCAGALFALLSAQGVFGGKFIPDLWLGVGCAFRLGWGNRQIKPRARPYVSK